MGFQLLWDRIEAKTARVVVIGLGYVGLPVAARFAQAGFQVTGLDVDEAKVALIGAGGCPIEGEEPGLAELVAQVVAAGRLRVTNDYAVCGEADVILSGDDDLLALERVGDIPILTAAQFLEMLERENSG